VTGAEAINLSLFGSLRNYPRNLGISVSPDCHIGMQTEGARPMFD
jgi:hypothetical protein